MEGEASRRLGALSEVKGIGERSVIPERLAGRQVGKYSLELHLDSNPERISGIIKVRGHVDPV